MWRTLMYFVGNDHLYSHYGKPYTGPQEIKTRTTIWCRNYPWEYVSDETKPRNQKDINISMFVAFSLTITMTWKPLKCSLIDKSVKKFSYIYIHTYTHNCIWLSHKKMIPYNNMNGPRGYHVKRDMTEKDKYLMKQCQTLYFGGPKSLQMVIAAMKLKDTYSLKESHYQPR